MRLIVQLAHTKHCSRYCVTLVNNFPGDVTNLAACHCFVRRVSGVHQPSNFPLKRAKLAIYNLKIHITTHADFKNRGVKSE